VLFAGMVIFKRCMKMRPASNQTTLATRAPDGALSFPVPLLIKLKRRVPMAIIKRRKSYTAKIGNIRVGSDAPVMVQSMTNTDTATWPQQ